jgi:glucokinase
MAGQDGGPLVLGVDLGGTKVLAGVVAPDNRILGRGKRATPAKEGGPAILAAMVECVDEALARAGVGREAIAAGGIGSPGPLDVKTGVILFSANLNVKNYPIGPELSAALGAPVIVQNDVRAGGYGEFMLGAGRGYRDVIAAFVGTGIGGCVVVDGRIVEGSTSNAGEIGHIVIKAGGPKCGCGQRGCMEALSSKTAIAGRIAKAVKKKTPTVLEGKMARKGGRLKSGDLAEAVDLGDPVAVREVRRAAHFLGLGLGGLVNVLGPQIVVVGGGVAQALGDPWLNLVRESARQQILTDPERKIQIVSAALGDDAAVLGAALLARENLLKN